MSPVASTPVPTAAATSRPENFFVRMMRQWIKHNERMMEMRIFPPV